MEIFKDIIGYEGKYQISNYGRIKSLKRKRVLKDFITIPTPDSNGYLTQKLWKNGVGTTERVHVLVAEAFLGHIRNGWELLINHIDNDKSNNHVENLEICNVRHNNIAHKPLPSGKYRGVTKYKTRKGTVRYKAVICFNRISQHLGVFDTAEEASIAYQNALNNQS